MLERKGECNGCGFCCKAIAYVELAFPNLLDDQPFLEARGIEKNGIKRLHVIDPCRHLGEENKCAIYEKRPKTCSDFPLYPEQIVNTPCSYWFEDENGVKIGGDASPYPSTSATIDDAGVNGIDWYWSISLTAGSHLIAMVEKINAKDEITLEAERGIAEIEAFLSEVSFVAA